MKTDRRHDLETNELATKLNDSIDYLKPHINKILLVLAAIVGLSAINSIINSKSVAKEEQAWEEYAIAKAATDEDRLALQKLAMSEEYVGTTMQEWAQLTWADHQVFMASRLYLRNREDAVDRTRRVKGLYEGLVDNAASEEIRDRAHFGLGLVYELQNKLDEARSEYARVQGSLKSIASERAEHLMDDQVKEVCDWLATTEFPKPKTNPGLGARPDFNAAVPNTSEDGKKTGLSGIEDLIKDFEIDTTDEERYQEEESTTDEEATSAEEPEAAANESEDEAAVE